MPKITWHKTIYIKQRKLIHRHARVDGHPFSYFFGFHK